MDNSKFQIEIDNITSKEWNNLITLFDDLTVFQTWEYGKKNSLQLSHLLIKYEGEVVACAQIRIFKLPFLRFGVAYLNHGPLWLKKNIGDNINSLKKIASVLINEYVVRRGLYLKINLEYEKIDARAEEIINNFVELGYVRKENQGQHLILVLDKSLDDLRKGLDQKWRNQLNIADRNSLEIIEGFEENYILEFSKIFKSMAIKKKFAKPDSIDGFIEVFRMLPINLRPLVVLCKNNDEYIAGGVFSTLGTTGIYLFGASNDTGRDLRASYLIQWGIINWLLENGFNRYNLSGANKINNAGTYHFKAGITKKNGFASNYLDSFSYCKGYINKTIVKFINKFIKKDF
jgi:lipid II:glycine glycyltransferase (peptidoglycan interpeptide bridge formation enzyme)